jgi:SepF-like predicted cell division protein (DUF552 family)
MKKLQTLSILALGLSFLISADTLGGKRKFHEVSSDSDDEIMEEREKSYKDIHLGSGVDGFSKNILKSIKQTGKFVQFLAEANDKSTLEMVINTLEQTTNLKFELDYNEYAHIIVRLKSGNINDHIQISQEELEKDKLDKLSEEYINLLFLKKTLTLPNDYESQKIIEECEKVVQKVGFFVQKIINENNIIIKIFR